jgi:hypothetical protein
MTILDIVLIIIGFFLVIFSYVITERVSDVREKTSTNGVTQVWGDKEEGTIKERVKDIVSDKSEEVIVTVEDRLCHLSNEKIMEFKEYSDEVMESIKEEHKQAVFLYNMLNEKENETKKLLNNLDKKYALLSDKVNKLIMKLKERSETASKKQNNEPKKNVNVVTEPLNNEPIRDMSKQGAILKDAVNNSVFQDSPKQDADIQDVLIENDNMQVKDQSETDIEMPVEQSLDEQILLVEQPLDAAQPSVETQPSVDTQPVKKMSITDKINDLNRRLSRNKNNKNIPEDNKVIPEQSNEIESVIETDVDNSYEVPDSVAVDIPEELNLSEQADLILEEAGLSDIPDTASDIVDTIQDYSTDTDIGVGTDADMMLDYDLEQNSDSDIFAADYNTDNENDTSDIIIPEETKPKGLLEQLEEESVEIPEYRSRHEDNDSQKSSGQDRNQRILSMWDEGKSVIDISRQLGIGQGEVKLVIDLYKGA